MQVPCSRLSRRIVTLAVLFLALVNVVKGQGLRGSREQHNIQSTTTSEYSTLPCASRRTISFLTCTVNLWWFGRSGADVGVEERRLTGFGSTSGQRFATRSYMPMHDYLHKVGLTPRIQGWEGQLFSLLQQCVPRSTWRTTKNTGCQGVQQSRYFTGAASDLNFKSHF